MFGQKKRIYLDYAAATPLDATVEKAMRPYWQSVFANPSAIHQEGVSARRAIERARTALASTLGVRASGITFTGSGTESNNLAIAGVIEARHQSGVAYGDMEVLTTAIEHPSVTNVLRAYQTRGVVVHALPLGVDGLVVLSEVKALLSPKTVLVTVGYVNSEVGTVQQLGALARVVRAYEKECSASIVVHTDAAQAPLWLSCQLTSLGVDLLSLDAGKCYGPKGVGVLAMKHGVTLAPVLFGGGQEAGLRPATENTPLIIGAVAALVRAQAEREEVSARVAQLRDRTILACEALSDVVLNGSLSERVANNVNISVGGVEAEFAVIALDAAGIAISTKSACSGADGAGSVVVRTLTGDEARAKTTLRITLGRETTARELDQFVLALAHHIEQTRTAHATLTHR